MTSPDHGALARRLRVSLGAEIDQQVGALADDLLELERTPDDQDRLRAVFRVFHTLKGAARAAGVPAVERLCHLLEERMVPLRDGAGRLEREDIDRMLAASDALRTVVPALSAGDAPEAGAVTAMIAHLSQGTPLEAARDESAAPPAPATASASQAQIRVPAHRIDELFGDVSELMVTGSRLQEALAEQAALHDRLVAWSFAWRRWSTRWQERAAHDAGTARPVAELDEEVRRLVRDGAGVLRRLTTDAREIGATQGRLGRSIHQLRLEPFGNACEALPRVVRDLTADRTKRVELVIEGADVTADRPVLEALRDPLIQLLRNAIDHGIEPVATRRALGKPDAGRIVVSASLHHDRLAVVLHDDGAGLDLTALRRAAEARGIALPEDDRGAIDALMGIQGISSRVEASDISGRGIGLDIVRSAVARLGGVLHVEWTPGQGTTFSLDLPLSLSLRRVVIVRVGAHSVAIPVRFVERLLRVRPEELGELQGKAILDTDDGPVPVVALADVLGPPYRARAATASLSVILVSAGARRAALVVDALVEERELVVRLLEMDRDEVTLADGMSQLPDGSIAPVVRVPQLLAIAIEQPTRPLALVPQVEAAAARRRILVVDDSITTRTLERSVLEAAGYEVESAVDGSEAWTILQARGADLVVADVEMPRMDGFALCEAIRASARFRELPVILVTARESPEDQARGLEAGATAYLGKSSFDQRQLLDVVAELLE